MDYAPNEIRFNEDPKGLEGRTCGLPGCKKAPVYADDDKRVYKVADRYFCSSTHAIIYNNMVLVGGNIDGYTTDVLKPYGGEDIERVDLPVKFLMALESEDFLSKSISVQLPLEEGVGPYYAQYKYIDETEFLSRLQGTRWHIAPGLLTKSMMTDISLVSPEVVYENYEEDLYMSVFPLHFARILTEQIAYLFSSDNYKPLPKATAKEVVASYRQNTLGTFATHSFELENGYLRPWRYTKKEVNLKGIPLMLWPEKLNDPSKRRGLYYGKVTGEGRIVYEFLIYAGRAVKYTVNEVSGELNAPNYEMYIQAYVNKVGVV